MLHNSVLARTLTAVCIAGPIAIGFAFPSAALAASPGTTTLLATGQNQVFSVPAGVTGIVLDLLGAQGGGDRGDGQPVTKANGGDASATVVVSPGQVLEAVVGGHGVDGGAGGFNGGGDGSNDVDGCCPSGGGGGGATDLRTGACASGMTCDTTARVLVAGGGGGAGGGSTSAEPGGAGGGPDGGAGTDTTTGSLATGGGGGTQGAHGDGGLGSSAGSPGIDPAQGGQGGGGGGGGGGGWFGGGGGAADDVQNGAGGGGGSGFVPSGSLSHLTPGGNTLGADGSAGFYWLSWSPRSPSSASRSPSPRIFPHRQRVDSRPSPSAAQRCAPGSPLPRMGRRYVPSSYRLGLTP